MKEDKLLKKIKSLTKLEENETYWLYLETDNETDIRYLVNRLDILLPKIKFIICSQQIKKFK